MSLIASSRDKKDEKKYCRITAKLGSFTKKKGTKVAQVILQETTQSIVLLG